MLNFGSRQAILSELDGEILVFKLYLITHLSILGDNSENFGG